MEFIISCFGLLPGTACESVGQSIHAGDGFHISRLKMLTGPHSRGSGWPWRKRRQWWRVRFASGHACDHRSQKEDKRQNHRLARSLDHVGSALMTDQPHCVHAKVTLKYEIQNRCIMFTFMLGFISHRRVERDVAGEPAFAVT